jgi:2'-5' RNA ligase
VVESAAESQRLFVALEIPDRVREDLHSRLEPWRRPLVGARWLPPENWHLTLMFIGATPPDRIDWVRASLNGAASRAVCFDSALTTFGGFPSPGSARVIWAGLEDRTGRISELARMIGAALEIEPEDRPFRAHVTVARSRQPLRLPEGFTTTPLPGAPFTVREMVLFRSHLGRPAPRYEPLARFPLGSIPIRG